MGMRPVGAVALVAVLALAGCSSDPDPGAAGTPASSPTGTADPTETADPTGPSPTGAGEDDGLPANLTVAGVAAETDDFSTLGSTLDLVGLVETLGGEGPFTLFAPTDEAFDALPAGVRDGLFLPENEDVLREVLAYHVLPAAVTSSDITDGEVATMEGESLSLSTAGGVITVNDDVTVTTPDVEATNGVVHVIDGVLIPPGVDVSAL